MIRGARGLAGLSQEELAAAAGIGRETVAAFERGERAAFPHNIDAMKRALEAAGVEFTAHDDGPCIRLRRALLR